MKTTEVSIQKLRKPIPMDNGIVSIGSCFAQDVAQKMKESGMEVDINPFGTVYNPVSVANSIHLLGGSRSFTEADVILRDTNPAPSQGQSKIPLDATANEHRPIAPAGGFVSFYHHGSFTRKSPEEFLQDANSALAAGRRHFSQAPTVLITFGTAWVYRHIERDIIVSNCHKHPAWEFRRELLDIPSIVQTWGEILNEYPEKEWIFTVSPIRHRKDGMHGNQISKSILLLAVEQLCTDFPNANYFPAYEIVLDELRDYSWFAEDGVHPSEAAVDYVWERFRQTFLSGKASDSK